MRTRLDAEALGLLARLPTHIPPGEAPAQLVLVFASQGSAPRGPGARMLCRDGRLLDGTIGGGRLEASAIAHAQRLAADAEQGQFAPHLRRFALGPELAQCCGGVVELLFLAVDSPRAEALAAEVAAAVATGETLRTDWQERCLEETPDAAATVLIFGAGHVGTAVAAALSVLPWRILVIDERPQWADADRLPAHTEVVCAAPLRLLAAWGWLGAAAAQSEMAGPARQLRIAPPHPPRCAALIMTHSHDVDRDLADALLRLDAHDVGGRLRHVGLIGSRTKVANLRRRLLERGLQPERLDELRAPIGLRIGDRMLGGKLPGEIAISAAAELLQCFSGSDAAP